MSGRLNFTRQEDVVFSGNISVESTIGEFNGTVTTDGRVTGTFTTDLFVNGKLVSTSKGDFSGAIADNKLEVFFSGQDISGQKCSFNGNFSATKIPEEPETTTKSLLVSTQN